VIAIRKQVEEGEYKLVAIPTNLTKTTIKKRLNKLIAEMEVNPTAEQTAKYSIAQTKVDVESLKSCLMAVRRQTLWDHWGLFLRDTFLPIASPV